MSERLHYLSFFNVTIKCEEWGYITTNSGPKTYLDTSDLVYLVCFTVWFYSNGGYIAHTWDVVVACS